jgi:hypothetical protein
MSSSFLLFTMLTIIFILLLITNISTSIGSAYSYSSIYYTSNRYIQYANGYLTIATVLGWFFLVTLMIIVAVAAVYGGFTSIDFIEAIETLNGDELTEYYKKKEIISRTESLQLLIIIMFVLIAIVTFIITVLVAIAAADLGYVNPKDPNVETAYITAIIAVSASMLAVICFVVAIISYMTMRITPEVSPIITTTTTLQQI